MIFIVAGTLRDAELFCASRAISPRSMQVKIVTPSTGSLDGYRWGSHDRVYVLSSTPMRLVDEVTRIARLTNFKLGDPVDHERGSA